MSEIEPPEEGRPRRVTLDVTLKRDPLARAAAASAPWTNERTWVLAFFVVFCLASWYAWVELRGHPIAGYVSALPQLTAVFAAVTTLLGGGDPTLGRPPVKHGVLGPQGFERVLQDQVSRHGLSALLRIPGILDRAIARAYGFAPSTPLQRARADRASASRPA